MPKRAASPPPPRVHAHCGHPLSRLHCYEIVPAGHWSFEDGQFVPVVSTEEGDDLYLELKCPHCGEVLNQKERRWALSLMREDEG